MEINQNLVPKWLMFAVGGLLGVFLLVMVVDKGYTTTRRFTVGDWPQNTISISAEGRVQAVPDLAVVNLGVVTNADTSTQVQTSNSEKINKITDFVLKQGVPAADITTTNFSIYPRYNYNNGQDNIIGYQATETITVKIKGVDHNNQIIGKILEGATNNGANQIQGVTFGFDDPDNLRQEARKLAIAKAKAKAEEKTDKSIEKTKEVKAKAKTKAKAEARAKSQAAMHASDEAKEHANEHSAVLSSSTQTDASGDVNAGKNGASVNGKSKTSTEAKGQVKKG